MLAVRGQEHRSAGPRSFEVAALDHLDFNGRVSSQMLWRLQASERGDGLDRDRGLRGPAEQSFPYLLPRGVILLACECGSPIWIDLQDTLVTKRRVLFHFQGKRRRVPPHDLRSISYRLVQARTDRSLGRRMALRPTVHNGVGWPDWHVPQEMLERRPDLQQAVKEL